MQTILLASNNGKKIAELSAILASFGIEIKAQRDYGIEDVPETGLTFVENALIKARHAARQSGLPAIADDSGLCVPALGGAPGIYSARYSGEGDAGNNRKLLAALENVQDRRAYYVCLIVYLRHADDPLPIIAQGLWHGTIALEARGDGGFGYDPLFVPAGDSRTAAEYSAAEKNSISHRARALAAFTELYLDLD
ncbi:MAG: RdgB/HAM1 family non-canonical purine NTP pyrophosphatase [Cardiobacterium hominis]|jgi:non-canonical purine NTP pyrophosphatase, rdgB/HAM1 family|uniref:dITP/XTP pyrophosphatase n=1 Tax=Cardiobacterium hominis (strain ATCC 15826 / DSM 8339 / NCTC 10426 / 6573) TaxID=638300 RepID=C8NBU0_CARH6|nr:RdgB/HAM1 family non-canonical purine NTP pyrophosphatase [Cardiobacterium hominis]EEV87928.1 non-canonical purine NTP pyrophosphatase, RdgB/HAM1 family [Cardiobacterium hominis ATCC 15826]VEG77718.1 dITP/XTP pyrophosphatase [Cardiobacterium hominis]